MGRRRAALGDSTGERVERPNGNDPFPERLRDGTGRRQPDPKSRERAGPVAGGEEVDRLPAPALSHHRFELGQQRPGVTRMPAGRGRDQPLGHDFTIAHHRDAYVVGRGVEASDRSHGRPTAISLRSPPS